MKYAKINVGAIQPNDNTAEMEMITVNIYLFIIMVTQATKKIVVKHGRCYKEEESGDGLDDYQHQ